MVSDWKERDCVICGSEDFHTGMAVGELTIGDVNMDLGDDGPICSRDCMFELDGEVYPYDTYAISDRFTGMPER